MQSTNIISRLARWSSEHRKIAILGWLAFVVSMFGLLSNGVIETERLTTAESVAGEAGDAEEMLTDAGLRPTSEVAFIQSENLTVKDPEFQAVISDVAAKLSSTDKVVNVTSPVDGTGGSYSEDGHSAMVEFEIAGDQADAMVDVEASIAAVEDLQEKYPEYNVEQFGAGSAEKGVNDTIQSDVGKAGMLSLPITLLVLLVALGALVAASVPLVLAITSVLATMAVVAIPSQVFPLDGNTDALILLIGLAVGVDYSLFYMRREREERAAGRSTKDALQAAAATSGRAVFISGLTVIIAMSGMFITGDATFTSFAVATVSVVIVAMTSTLLVLPAVLAWLGDRVEKGRIPFIGRRRKQVGGESRFWSAVTGRVTRHPVVATVLAGGLLVALAVPALSMNIVQSGTDDLPQDLAIVQTYDRYTEAFPAEANGIEVAVEADDVTAGPVAAGIDDLVSEAEASGVAVAKTEVTVSDDKTVASVAIPTAGNGTDKKSMADLDVVRDELIPETIGAVDGSATYVTGGAAQTSDFSQLLKDRMPLVFAFVLGLAFLLMLVTFRSIVIPIKAIILNLLSVGAAYGVLVLVFQNGWGEELLGFESNGGITNWLPLFLFVILFGLSMDYHVFILTRIRELYDRGMSTEDAVRKGIAGSAGTVTAAAVVMVLVFSVFATLSYLDFKEMGVGLAVAILIDATIIRGVLLPASMSLLGDWNWWLPKSLQWLPKVRHEASPEAARA
ncbi:MAG TPA: MMPL family transporter [Solirubrobacterales bacterium]|nr:MMPL family transporter [Solirubrobacterales bacterium]